MLGLYITGDVDAIGVMKEELERALNLRTHTIERFTEDDRAGEAVALLTKLWRDAETLRGTEVEIRLKEALDRWVEFVNESGDLHGKRQNLREQFGSGLLRPDDYESDESLMTSLSEYFIGVGFRYFPATVRDFAEEITRLISDEIIAMS